MPIPLSERTKINHELKKVGFGGLNDPNTIQQIATLYRTHNSFRGLLMSTKPAERNIAYNALRPHLCFTPKPLDVYEREIHEKAEREQWDTWNSATYMPEAFKVGEIETDQYKLEQAAQDAIEANAHEKAKGVASLICTRCTVEGRFPAQTKKLALKKAHEDGWRWEEKNGTTKTYCPEHVPGRAMMTLECSECHLTQRYRVWDQQDGYAKARLAGWEISEAAKCPGCVAKLILVQ